jgi:hypothetical protein
MILSRATRYITIWEKKQEIRILSDIDCKNQIELALVINKIYKTKEEITILLRMNI